MTGTFKISGNNTKIIFEYEALTETIQSIVEDASHYLWKEDLDDEGNITNPFEELTNQEKLDLVDEHVKTVIKNIANTYKSVKAQEDARNLEKLNEYSI